MKKNLLMVLLIIMFNSILFAGTGNDVSDKVPNVLIVIPFIVLLLMIATGPIFYHHFWEKHYPKVSMGLGAITVVYYIFILKDFYSLTHTLIEYISFIALLSSLYMAAGGILIKIDRKATPMFNTLLLLFGAVIANIVGTTGASMLLIRPYIKINKDRIKTYHIIFFIFIVSNIGGSLTPIGDPPLFLGFLRGIEFFWFFNNLFSAWFIGVLLILIIFYFFDSRNISKGSTVNTYTGKIEFKGLKNIVYLIIILISVFLDPNIITWVPNLYEYVPFGIREIIMFTIVYLSIKTSDKNILKENDFNYEPIKEVAYLFIGIFATMIPALQLISYEAKIYSQQLNVSIFYWSTGFLSGFLDNAPTFLNFFAAQMAKFGLDITSKSDVMKLATENYLYLHAISVAAVFFGAFTYIGNGPNFMVKAISEKYGIKMPSFFEYIYKYSLPILIPIFIVIYFIFYFGK
jgi:Na+/H+ antiporter NhaD/arsenite permease-like protein